jgi:hypothetical protein
MPAIRVDEGDRYPNLEQEVERVELGCFGPTADGGERLRLEQRGRVEQLNGLNSNPQAPMKTASHPSPPNSRHTNTRQAV